MRNQTHYSLNREQKHSERKRRPRKETTTEYVCFRDHYVGGKKMAAYLRFTHRFKKNEIQEDRAVKHSSEARLPEM